MKFFDFKSYYGSFAVDDKFLEILWEANQNFSKQIMMDLTLFSFDPSKYGFADLDLISKEYTVQRFFEKRVESYVRQYLVISVFEKAFEEKGFEIYTPTYIVSDEEYVEGEIICSNAEYEDRVGFEFVIDNGSNLIGCRLTDIDAWKAKRWISTGLVNHIIVIDWYNIDGITDEEKARRTYGVSECVDILGIREFVKEWIGDTESVVYELFMRRTIQNYKETIGISSLPKLTAPIMFKHRLEEEKMLKSFSKDILYYAEREQQESQDTHFGYRLIDANCFCTPKEIECAMNIEERSKKLLSETGIIDNFSTRQLYKALSGKSDFANSFLTSEYLFSQYDENDCFDYTAIVSGYLKSIEQLLSVIVFGFADQSFQTGDQPALLRIKSNGKRKPNGKYPSSSRKENNVYKIDLTMDEADYVDTTLGSLTHFVNDYKHFLMTVDYEHKKTIVDSLVCYRIDCRNASFHTHNNYDWERVKTIRHNTKVLYIMLLGGMCLDQNTKDFAERFDIIEDDRLERVYYYLRKMHMYSFKVKFEGDPNYYLATRHAEESFPRFDKNGLLHEDFGIEIGCKIDMTGNQPEKRLIINRDNIPEEIWYTSLLDSYPIDFSI